MQPEYPILTGKHAEEHFKNVSFLVFPASKSTFTAPGFAPRERATFTDVVNLTILLSYFIRNRDLNEF